MAKTWSRELAILMWVGVAVLMYNDQTEMADVVVWPITVFTLAAFGFRQPAVSDWMRGRTTELSDRRGS